MTPAIIVAQCCLHFVRDGFGMETTLVGALRAPCPPSCYKFVRGVQGRFLILCCCPQFNENDFKDRACPECKARASEVEQFEQALPQKVSEASQAMKHFSLEHAACAQQYAVRVKRSTANVLLASETGRALRWLAKQCICVSASSVHGLALCAFF